MIRKIRLLLAALAMVIGPAALAGPAGAEEPEEHCTIVAGHEVCLEVQDQDDPPCAVTLVNPPGFPPGSYCLVRYP